MYTFLFLLVFQVVSSFQVLYSLNSMNFKVTVNLKGLHGLHLTELSWMPTESTSLSQYVWKYFLTKLQLSPFKVRTLSHYSSAIYHFVLSADIHATPVDKQSAYKTFASKLTP
jgi:hypothetical protein